MRTKTTLENYFLVDVERQWWQWCGNIDGKPWQSADGFTSDRIGH